MFGLTLKLTARSNAYFYRRYDIVHTKLDTKLVSIGMLNRKGFTYSTARGLLTVKNKDAAIMIGRLDAQFLFCEHCCRTLTSWNRSSNDCYYLLIVSRYSNLASALCTSLYLLYQTPPVYDHPEVSGRSGYPERIRLWIYSPNFLHIRENRINEYVQRSIHENSTTRVYTRGGDIYILQTV